MQASGYVLIFGEKIKVLVYEKRTSRLMKMRKTGTDGQHFIDEEEFLSAMLNMARRLINGETIEL